MNDLPLPQWLLRWLSIDPSSLEGGEANLRLARFPEGELGLLALLVVAAGIAIVFLTYSREGALARWKKYSIASIRALLVLLLALVVFYPIIEVSREKEIRKSTILLLDDSLSLTLKDGYRSSPATLRSLAGGLKLDPARIPELTRAELVNRLLRDPDQKLLELLQEKNRLEIYTFSNELRRPTLEKESATESTAKAPAKTELSLTPEGTVTNLSAALGKAV